jgi:4-diphosphocytidyl-2-C-methyl-D-erythritol kinase
MIASRCGAGVQLKTPAKLNLFFEVLGKRSDGFHEIETLMAPIDLFDDLFFETDPSGRITVECSWACAPGNRSNELGELPDASNNLATHALFLLKKKACVTAGARLRIVKRIPAAAGLGGGSSDAACALQAANIGWRLDWSREQLATVAAELGSDVPFFLFGDAAICRGRGEKIEIVNDLGNWHAVVVRPPTGLSTSDVYKNCRRGDPAKQIEPLVTALRTGNSRDLSANLFNRLEQSAESISPWIATLRREFGRLDGLAAQMSGSGSSYFGIFRSARQARRAGARLRARRVGSVFVVRVGK